jgi:hypothetical protein
MGAQIKPLAGVICGLYSAEAVVRSALPLSSNNLKMVEVWLQNFSENAAVVVSSLESNYTFIGLLAEMEKDLQHQATVDDAYTRFRNTVNRAQTIRIVLAMVSRDAQVVSWPNHPFGIKANVPSLRSTRSILHPCRKWSNAGPPQSASEWYHRLQSLVNAILVHVFTFTLPMCH